MDTLEQIITLAVQYRCTNVQYNACHCMELAPAAVNRSIHNERCYIKLA